MSGLSLRDLDDASQGASAQTMQVNEDSSILLVKRELT
jgi:hypothetical protein